MQEMASNFKKEDIEAFVNGGFNKSDDTEGWLSGERKEISPYEFIEKQTASAEERVNYLVEQSLGEYVTAFDYPEKLGLSLGNGALKWMLEKTIEKLQADLDYINKKH